METSVQFLHAMSTWLLVAENVHAEVFCLLACAYFNLLTGEQGIYVHISNIFV